MRSGARRSHGIILRRTQQLLLVGGVGCLLLWLVVKAEGLWTTARASSVVAAARADAATAHRAPDADGERRGPWPVVPEEGDVIGLVEVGTRGVRAPVLQGASDEVLRRSVGHLVGTALPGQPGNCVLAGHRDSDFRGLADIRLGDRIRLETVKGSFSYEVSDVDTVTPDAVEVLDPTEEESLTLLTCYPFDWVGPAPRRLVVRAHRVGR